MNKLTFEKLLLTYAILTIIAVSVKNKNLEIILLNSIIFISIYFETKNTSINKFDIKALRSFMYIGLAYPIICILNSLTKPYKLTDIRNPIAYLIFLVISILLISIFYFKLKSYKFKHLNHE